MQKQLNYYLPLVVFIVMLAAFLLIHTGTAFAADENSDDAPVTEQPRAIMEQQNEAGATLPVGTPEAAPENTPREKKELFPSDIQTVITDTGRQIIKSYTLTADDKPADIPRESFIRDGWRYSLTDITQHKISGTDVRAHTETVEIESATKDMNEILQQLAPALPYESADGYFGVLTLDLASVVCTEAGYKNSNYTVSATREYPHLSTNDLSLIPKNITEKGRTLTLDSVNWEAQQTSNIDYVDIPQSYRAVATYTAKASASVVTGYVTTAEYKGDVAKAVTGDTIYVANFVGENLHPALALAVEVAEKGGTEFTLVPLLSAIIILAALLGGGIAFLLLRHNVKVYNLHDGSKMLVAKVRISEKHPVIDLTPLEGRAKSNAFSLEIDRLGAKAMSGKTLDIVYGGKRLNHIIAYEGGVYRIEANFDTGTIKVLY